MTASKLNEKEITILRMLVDGLQNIDIAQLLTVNIQNVELRIENILRKLQAKSKTEAVVKAIKHSII